MTCERKHDICITWGDRWEKSVGLTRREDIAENLGGYQMVWTFKEFDGADAPVLLQLTGIFRLSDVEPTDPPGISVYADFAGTSDQMKVLPLWEHYYTVDLLSDKKANSTRLFEGKVRVNE